MASWKNWCWSQQQATWHRGIHARLSHKGPVWLGAHSKAGWKDSTRRQWSPLVSSLAVEVEAVTHAIQWLASQRDAQITHAVILTDSMNLLQKMGSGMGYPDWQHSHAVFGCKDFCGSIAQGMPESEGMNGQIDWQAQQLSHQVWQVVRAEMLRGLRNFLNMDGPEESQHRSPEGKRSGGRKQSTFRPPRSRTIRVQPNKHPALFREQPWGDCWETGRIAYGPFRALRCHLEQKPKLAWDTGLVSVQFWFILTLETGLLWYEILVLTQYLNIGLQWTAIPVHCNLETCQGQSHKMGLSERYDAILSWN